MYGAASVVAQPEKFRRSRVVIDGRWVFARLWMEALGSGEGCGDAGAAGERAEAKGIC